MNSDQGAGNWDAEYFRRGRVWGGAVHNLPLVTEGSRVLELGCGNGKTFAALAGKGCEVIGVDFSSTAALLCRSQVREPVRGNIAVADICYLPFSDASFDAVVAFHVIGHLPARERVNCARQAERVLRDKGALYFSAFSVEDFRAGTGCKTEPGTVERKNGISTHYFSEDEVRALFPALTVAECNTRRWTMTVRGRPLPRAEIVATFVKP